ncbi:MAG: hypothetical protein QOH48_1088 [Actinomycetota bacterium]|nr:hypothetical protein [Actinomycetota bacterium]
MVGAAGFEPATSASQTPRANQAALRPVVSDGTGGRSGRLSRARIVPVGVGRRRTQADTPR